MPTEYIASIAIVDLDSYTPIEAHNRVEHRRAAKSNRTRNGVKQGLKRLSPLAVSLPSNPHKILVINLPYDLLSDWAKRSHIQEITYIEGEEKNKILDKEIKDLIREINQKIHDNLHKIAADTGMDIPTLLDWAHNHTGYKAAHIRRKVYHIECDV